MAGGAEAHWEDASSSDDEMESLESKLKHEESTVISEASGGSAATSESRKERKKAAKFARQKEQENVEANADFKGRMKIRYKKLRKWSRITWVKTKMLTRKKNRQKG
jgi:hypothetical protein